MNLKDKVNLIWQEAGSPKWDYTKTLDACLEANNYFSNIHQNPAKRFREEVEKNNQKYIRQWVMGCHFDWLNPR